MFSDLEPLPGDPILALMAAYREDDAGNKVDLGVGVYQDEQGRTPVLGAVTAAERMILEHQTTKSYVGIAGSEPFNHAMTEMLFGADHQVVTERRVATVQSAGGSGGLRVAGELIDSLRPGCTVWVSTPTWPNHRPLLTAAGMRIAEFSYYDPASGRIDEAAMLADIEAIPDGDVLLLHGCCHNPTGADLGLDQWQAIASLCQRKNLLPMIDIAYQGFAEGLDEDVAGLRLMASVLPELIAVASCSKNFGLYRERTGSLSVVTRDTGKALAVRSHMMKIVRSMISMPPDHGASIVALILTTDTLRRQWIEELDAMRTRMREQRLAFTDAMSGHGFGDRFGFIADQRGMFSLLGVEASVIDTLREQWHVYIVGSGRINVAGLTKAKLPYVAEALAATLSS